MRGAEPMAASTPVQSGWHGTAPGDGLVSEAELLTTLPAPRRISVEAVRAQLRASERTLVVLDDDPTGTQTVADVPVLTGWSLEDLRWAFRQHAPAFYVLSNTRSLDPQQAAGRNREIVDRLFDVAQLDDHRFAIVSRGDSTLRGHYPLETDVIAQVLAERTGHRPDGVVLCPAYIDAGRVTVADTHWLRNELGMLPVGASEFARDATFGFASSNLREFVEERSGGRWQASEVVSISLDDIRGGGPRRVTQLLLTLRDAQPAVVNATCDDDLRVVALGALVAEAQGLRLLYRTGPSFVRARAGLDPTPPLRGEALRGSSKQSAHGLIVVGSHVALTTRQLRCLRKRRGGCEIELDVAALLDPVARKAHVRAVADHAVAALDASHALIRTTRTVVTATDPAQSLAIARHVSAALVDVVRQVTAATRPRFVLAKGGITSSDVATHGLGIRRAWVRGTLLPGIVSVWSAVDGVAPGMPYVVFAGNVGSDQALADAVDALDGES